MEQQKSGKRKKRAILFDVDGTLLNSMSLYFDITTTEIKKRGVNLDEFMSIRADIEQDMLEEFSSGDIGGGVLMAIKLFSRIGSYAGFSRIRNFFFTASVIRKIAKIYHDVPLFDDVIPSLDRIATDTDFKMGIVSMASKKQIDESLTKTGILEYFEVIITRDDVTKSKPDPQGVLKACSAMNIPPEECYMIGDLPFDVMAAKTAGA
ncbi:MAG: HAD family hydrolase, partial [Candidatus Hodarchaeales archaeon]